MSLTREEQPAGSTRTLETVRDGAGRVTSQVRRTILPSGLRIVSEQMAGVRSASVGVWVEVGSRHESPALHGCSHFLEHLLFKGTGTRSALDISIALDRVGGEFNAFTAKEYTCFHARVLDHDFPVAVDVLGDLVTDSLLEPDDVEAEREVILDEIAMHDDDPDDAVHNLFAEQAWGRSPLGRSIAGTADSISALGRETIARFYRRHYRPERMVVSAAGNIEHRHLVRLVKRSFARNGFLDGTADPALVTNTTRSRRARGGRLTRFRPLEQVNLVLGVQGITRADDRRFALGVLNAALGGGTSSRLFQEVRERRGLAYSVFSFANTHADAGLVGVSVGCLPGRFEQVVTTVREQLAVLAAEGITPEELERGQGQLRGGMVLGMEDSGARMSRLGKAELLFDAVLSTDEVLSRIDAVTVADVSALAADLFARPELLAVVGPLSES